MKRPAILDKWTSRSAFKRATINLSTLLLSFSLLLMYCPLARAAGAVLAAQNSVSPARHR